MGLLVVAVVQLTLGVIAAVVHDAGDRGSPSASVSATEATIPVPPEGASGRDEARQACAAFEPLYAARAGTGLAVDGLDVVVITRSTYAAADAHPGFRRLQDLWSATPFFNDDSMTEAEVVAAGDAFFKECMRLGLASPPPPADGFAEVHHEGLRFAHPASWTRLDTRSLAGDLESVLRESGASPHVREAVRAIADAGATLAVVDLGPDTPYASGLYVSRVSVLARTAESLAEEVEQALRSNSLISDVRVEVSTLGVAARYELSVGVAVAVSQHYVLHDREVSVLMMATDRPQDYEMTFDEIARSLRTAPS